VMSSTYRQASQFREELREADPRNRWLARQNRFRVNAELVRDLALAAADELDARIGGPSFRPAMPKGAGAVVESFWSDARTPDEHRRGLYIAIQRTTPFPMLATFDAPDSNVTCARRLRSNTPLQALTLLNSPVFVEAARKLGGRLNSLWKASESTEKVIQLSYRICFGRRPDEAEQQRVKQLWASQKELFQGLSKDARDEVGSDADLAAWTGVARALINTDEFVTRE